MEQKVYGYLHRRVERRTLRDFNQRYFAVSNVDIDGVTGQVVGHEPSHLVTFASDVAFDPEAQAPRFLRFICEIMDNDLVSVDFVQEMMGYMLTPLQKANSIFFMYSKGASGKSVLTSVLSRMIGVHNVAAVSLQDIENRFAKADLLQKKMSISTENGAATFSTSILKAVTSGDAIQVDIKFKDGVTAVLPTKFIFVFNALPVITDSTLGFTRRLKLLPFPKTYLGNQQDRDLTQKLYAELPGILNFALAGLKRLIDHDYTFSISDAMQKATDEYLLAGNPVQHFLARELKVEHGARTETSEIVQAYVKWAADNNYLTFNTQSPQIFWRKLDESLIVMHGFKSVRSKSNGRLFVHDLVLAGQENHDLEEVV
nr:phage/plasmid primase, P4 family [Lacticaseibacillus absianus]